MLKRLPVLTALSIVAIVGAPVAAVLAWLTYGFGCESRCTDDDSALLIIQVAVAMIGLVPAGAALAAAVNHRRNATRWLLALCIGIYLVWGLLNDAALHGWDDLQVF